MFSSSQLTDDQKSLIETWANEGDQLDDIQKKLLENCDLSLTYMETRFLVLDLKIDLKVEEEPKPEEESLQNEEPVDSSNPINDTLPEAAPAPSMTTEADMAIPASRGGGVELTLDSIAIPGTMVSGKVTFSDGERAGWYVDTNGQLGLDCDNPAYRPSESELSSFQSELRKSLESQ